MNLRSALALMAAFAATLFFGCQSVPSPLKPVLADIQGNGRWTRATATTPDTFGFAVAAAEECPPGNTNLTCPRRYPDTAFIDFDIPSLTNFSVSSGGTPFTLVGPAAPMGDFQYRRTQLSDGSSGTTRWRIAVGIPINVVQSPPAPRTWCPVTRFNIDIVDEAGSAKSAPLPVALVWGRCSSPGPTFWYASSGSSSGPPQSNPPSPPVGDCPGGAAASAFEVCERCGTTGLPVAKTFWGCSLSDAQQKMGMQGCAAVLRPASGNC